MITKNIIPAIAIILTLTGCSDMLSRNPNRAPDAVLAFTTVSDFYPGYVITLDGCDSDDVDDQDLSYEWEVISTTASTRDEIFTGKTTANPRFSSTHDGSSYVVRLTVTDEYDVPNSVDMTIDVFNNAPVPGGSFTPALGSISDIETMTITGTNLDNDPERDAVCSYAWSIIDRPDGCSTALSGTGDMDLVGTLASGNEDTADVTIDLDIPGVYKARLTTTDEWGKTGSYTHTIVTDYTIELTCTNTEDDTLDYTWIVNNFTGITAGLPMSIESGTSSDRTAGSQIYTDVTPIDADSENYDSLLFSFSENVDIGSGDTFSINAEVSDGHVTDNERIYFQVN